MTNDEIYELRKTPKSFKCTMCRKKVHAKLYRLEAHYGMAFFCLLCGEQQLNSDRASTKEKMRLINKCLQRMKRMSKDKVVQRLDG